MSTDVLTPSAGGLFCAAGNFWIDPLRPVDRAIVTHAHADHARSGSGEYHSSAAGLPALKARVGDMQRHQAHEYGVPFELGDTRVTLFPAGHILGSAWVRIESEQGVWGVSGDFKRAPDPTCAPFEAADCDVWLTECTFGLPVYQWPETATVIQQIESWWQRCIDQQRPAVLFCYALGKAQRIMAELTVPKGHGIWIHGAMKPLIEAYREAGIELPEARLVSEAEKGQRYAGDLVLAPPSAAGSAWMRRFRGHSSGFVSGWMRIRGHRRRRGYDRGFILSDHADWPALIQTAADMGAQRVITIHGNGDALARYLKGRGLEAASWDLRASLSAST